MPEDEEKRRIIMIIVSLFVSFALVVTASIPVLAQDKYNPAVSEAILLLNSAGLVKEPPVVRLVNLDEVAHLQVVGRHLRGFQVTIDGDPDPTVYIVRSNDVYRLAARGNRLAILLLAGTILHEQIHVQGGNEKDALKAEIRFLRPYMATLPSGVWQALAFQIQDLEKQLKVLKP